MHNTHPIAVGQTKHKIRVVPQPDQPQRNAHTYIARQKSSCSQIQAGWSLIILTSEGFSSLAAMISFLSLSLLDTLALSSLFSISLKRKMWGEIVGFVRKECDWIPVSFCWRLCVASSPASPLSASEHCPASVSINVQREWCNTWTAI